MQIVPIKYQSPENEQMLVLRTEVLRKPLGLTYTSEQLQAEAEHLMYVTMEADKIIGCYILQKISDTQLQMRQVAVAPSFQNKGIGAQMLLHAESEAVALGYDSIFCHARDVAKNFYLKNNWQIEGEAFYEVGILHYKMSKHLR